jgi:hypothetical protein
MGSEISAGRLFRPIETPRPAEPPPRPDSGGEGFQSYLESARLTAAPRATPSARRGESARQPKSTDRKNHDIDTQESVQPQTSVDQPTDSGKTADAATNTTAAVAGSTEAPAPTQETQPSDASAAKAANTMGPSVQQRVIESLPPPTNARVKKQFRQPLSRRIHSESPAGHHTINGEIRPLMITSLTLPNVGGAFQMRPSCRSLHLWRKNRLQATREMLAAEQGFAQNRKAGFVPSGESSPAPRWSPEVGVTQRPAEKPTPDPLTRKIKESNSNGRAADRADGKLGRPTPLDGAEPRAKDAGGVDPDEHVMQDRASPRLRPISVRTGAGDSAAATVGRFLIETTGKGEPTTANVPSSVDLKTSNTASPGVTPYRATTDSSKTADVTVTTLSRLLVSGAEGADAIDSAAKVLSGAQREGDHHVTLQLDPPELGQLRLDIRMHQQEMTLRVAADNASVARLIDSRMTDLRDALALHGIRIDRSDVVVRSHSAEGANAQTSRHDNSPGTMNGVDRAEKSDVAWSDDHRREAARDEQSGADRQPAGSASLADDETPGTPMSWESGMEGFGMEQTWVDLVA